MVLVRNVETSNLRQLNSEVTHPILKTTCLNTSPVLKNNNNRAFYNFPIMTYLEKIYFIKQSEMVLNVVIHDIIIIIIIIIIISSSSSSSTSSSSISSSCCYCCSIISSLYPYRLTVGSTSSVFCVCKMFHLTTKQCPHII